MTFIYFDFLFNVFSFTYFLAFYCSKEINATEYCRSLIIGGWTEDDFKRIIKRYNLLNETILPKSANIFIWKRNNIEQRLALIKNHMQFFMDNIFHGIFVLWSPYENALCKIANMRKIIIQFNPFVRPVS